MTFSTISKLLSEFIGTYLLVLAVGLNVMGGTVLGVTAIAFTLMISIYALGDVSGANFNPAVSLALTLSRKLAIPEMLGYWVAQLLGGAAAAGTFGLLDAQNSPAALGTYDSLKGPVLAEMCFTCMLCFVVLNVAATKMNQPNQYYGLAIGLAIIGGGYASGPISGGELNPAVAAGLAIYQKPFSASTLGGLVAGEFLGAVLAAMIYRIVHPEEFEDGAQTGPLQKLLGEAVGTFYLVLTVSLNVLNKEKYGAWSIAATLACMVYCFASVSGAHLNPAVTMASMVRGKAPAEAAGYMVAQWIGGLVGAVMAISILPGKDLALGVGEGYSLGAACGAELIFTFVLTFVVLNIATVDGKNVGEIAGFVVGACVVSGGFAIGRISGASLNPAVSAGLSVAGQLTHRPENQLQVFAAYVGCELLAGILAAVVFKTVRMTDDNDAPEPDDEEKQALLKDHREDAEQSATDVLAAAFRTQ